MQVDVFFSFAVLYNVNMQTSVAYCLFMCVCVQREKFR